MRPLLVATQVGNAARWYSTQEVATCLRAISKYAKAATFGDKTDFVVKNGSKEMPVNSTTSVLPVQFHRRCLGQPGN
jgi:hypothetical protein